VRGVRYRFEGFVLDTATRELTSADGAIDLEPQVFDVLAHLLANGDRVVSKEELLDEVWGDRFVSESALTTRIKQVRQAVGDNGRDQRVVRTLHGRGYRIVAAVHPGDGASQGEGASDEAPPDGRPLPAGAGPHVATGHGVPRTRYASSGGASIAYQVFGDGPPLVFVAGFTTNVEVQWEHPTIARFLRELGSFARVIMLDKRGVGLSERIHEAELPSLETRADDLHAVMDAAGVERATVLGSSEGGALSVVFAATHPELVDRLILHGTWARHPWFGEERDELDQIEQLWGTGGILRYLAPSFARTQADKRFLARLERMAATPGSARRLQELSMAIDVTPVLSAIAAPTLVIHRSDDEVAPIDNARGLAAAIPGARFVELPGDDHWVFSGDGVPILHAIREHVAGPVAPPATARRVLASVLFVDIVGSTRTARELGDQRWSELLDRFEELAASTVSAHQGEIVKTTGDGVVAVFDGPGRAVLSALELRSAVAPLGLELRAGVHTAEIERRGTDIAGIGVHIASRVADAASPGEVWVSRTVTDLVAGTGLQFRSRGSVELAGLDEPWTLFEALA
jgi:pimeloyl-ACP methyl ester carboxylesterase/class 3 adenylate cyclase/DNA-binding winged helix-turn-helix (wHTH) protein